MKNRYEDHNLPKKHKTRNLTHHTKDTIADDVDALRQERLEALHDFVCLVLLEIGECAGDGDHHREHNADIELQKQQNYNMLKTKSQTVPSGMSDVSVGWLSTLHYPLSGALGSP